MLHSSCLLQSVPNMSHEIPSRLEYGLRRQLPMQTVNTLSLSLWFHLLYWSTYNPFNPLQTLFLSLLFFSDHIFIILSITGVMEMKQVQRDHVAMRTRGISHRIKYALGLSVRIWTISLQWPCASLRGNEGLITYSTVRGHGAEKYRTSERPLWTVAGGLQRTERRE